MTRELTYREALGLALREALAGDERVLLLGQDIGARGGPYGVTAGLLEDFGPERVRDAPNAEASLLGVAIGAALAGRRPVVELTSAAFAALAFDQLIHHAAALEAMSGGRLRAPLVLRVPQTTGTRLGPVHSADLSALLHHVPGLTVAAPATPGDAHALLGAAIAADGPVVLLEHTTLYGTRGEIGGEAAPLGRAAVRRAGTDVTLVAWSRMTRVAAEAADVLAAEHGVEATVVDLRSLRPLDVATVTTAVRATEGRTVVVEEGWPRGGVGATLAAELPGARVARVTGADAFVPYARTLEAAALPGVADVVGAALALVGTRVATRPARVGAPRHTLTLDVDMEALVAARRAGGGELVDVVARACAPVLAELGTAAVTTPDGAIATIGAGGPHGEVRHPAATVALGAVVTRPTAAGGAVTIRHTAPLTLHVTAGNLTADEASTLLAALRARLESPAGETV
jgi:pyruvate dehydrogenase E1 component beta subunit